MPKSKRKLPHLVNLEGQELHIRLKPVPRFRKWRRIYPQKSHRFNIVQYSEGDGWVNQSYRLNLSRYTRAMAIRQVQTFRSVTQIDKGKAIALITKYYRKGI